MRTPVFFTGSSTSNVSNSATRYAPFSGGGNSIVSFNTSSGGYISAAVHCPIDCVISALRVRFPTPLTQGTYTITLIKGSAQNAMADTALSVTIGTSGIDAINLAASVAVAAGEYLAWKIVPSGTPTAQTNSIQIACLMEAVTAGRSAFFSYIATGSTSTAVAPNGGSAPGATEADRMAVMPVGGTITKLFVSLNANSGAPGSGNSRTVTLRKGTAIGGLSDTALTVTFGPTDVEKVIDLSGSPIAVAAGDFLSIAGNVGGTPAATPVKIAMEFIPATSGLAVLFLNVAGTLSNTTTRLLLLSGASGANEATGANSQQIVPAALTVKSVRMDTNTAPGSGKSRLLTLRKGAGGTTALADTALVANLAGTAITAAGAVDVAFDGGDTINFTHAPSGTPANMTWTGVAAVVEVAAPEAGVTFAPGDKSGQTFEGVRNTSLVVVNGAYSGSPTSVEVSLWNAPTGGTMVKGWAAAAVQAGGVYAHGFSDVPVGGPYFHRVRDNGGAATASNAVLYVGAVVVLWGQSQMQKLHTDDINGLTPQNGMQVRILTYSNQNDVSGASTTITKYDSSTTNLSLRTGSGVVALAHEWHARTGGAVPLLIVVSAYQGTSIRSWVNDFKGDFPTNSDVTTLWGTSPTTGFAWFMAAAAKYQASAIVFMQGTADVNQIADVGGTGFSYSQMLDQLKAKFEALYNGTAVPPLFLMVPHQRTDDGPNTWAMRAVQYAKAISGGLWRLGAWLLDWQMDSNGSPHQATGATGNIRGGTRIGRGIAKHLFDGAIDIGGPQIVSAIFNAGRTEIDITFDRDIETPAGVTTGIQGVFVSTDNGATWPTAPAAMPWTVALVSARVARVTSTGAAFPSGTTRIDFFRGIPFASDAAATDVVGTEANMEANFLSKVIVDTSAFDGGRGLPVAPIMGTGFGVADSNGVVPVGMSIGLIAGAPAVGVGGSLLPVGITVPLVAGSAAVGVSNAVNPVSIEIPLEAGQPVASFTPALEPILTADLPPARLLNADGSRRFVGAD